jgi:hypothetical protein
MNLEKLKMTYNLEGVLAKKKSRDPKPHKLESSKKVTHNDMAV